MSVRGKVLRKTRQVLREIGDGILPVIAEGTAQATELAADGTRRTADAARQWADEVQGVTTRRRLLTGMALVGAISAIVVYLTSSAGKGTLRKLPEPVREIIEKAS